MTNEELKEVLDDYYRRPIIDRLNLDLQVRGRIRQDYAAGISFDWQRLPIDVFN